MWRLGHTLLAWALTWPVGLGITSYGDKPVDFIPSDLLIPLLFAWPLPWLGLRRKPQRRLWVHSPRVFALVYLFLFYCVSLAAINVLTGEGVVALLSVAKFIKAYFLVLGGALVAMNWRTSVRFFRIHAGVFSLVVLLVLGTAVLEPSSHFRFGANLLGWDCYGFPNSSASFFAALTTSLLAAAIDTRRLFLRLWFVTAYCCTWALVVLSLSRSSLVVGAAVTLAFFTVSSRTTDKFGNQRAVSWEGFAVVLLAAAGLWGVQSHLAETPWGQRQILALVTKTNATLGGDDPLSGRPEIWRDALSFSARRPLFGFMFKPFDAAGGTHGTPHQQYLEVLFKTGVLGLVLFLAVWGCAWLRFRMLMRSHGDETEARPFWAAVWAALAGLLVGNLTQPNFTFSLTGNWLCFFLGVALVQGVRSHAPPHSRQRRFVRRETSST